LKVKTNISKCGGGEEEDLKICQKSGEFEGLNFYV